METATATAGPVTTLIAGMGGQGVVLAGDILAEAALLANLNVKKSEIHGLSRRFGSVSCQVRFGRELHSPLRGHGGVDVLLAFEGYECLKHLPFLGPRGVALANRLWSKPGATMAVAETPPGHDDPRIEWFDGTDLTHQAECPRSLNFFMLGVLSARLTIAESAWHKAVKSVKDKPASRDVNREMFAAGRRVALPVTARHVNGRTRAKG